MMEFMRYAPFYQVAALKRGAFSLVFVFASALPALAVPSFSQQTDQPCSASRVGAFGHQRRLELTQSRLKQFYLCVRDA
jgi:hypothetical protein